MAATAHRARPEARRATSPSSWMATAAGPSAAACRGTAGHRAGVEGRARDRRGLRAARRRGADAVRVLERELAPPGDGSRAR
ncbi:MAG: hypothetical protein MZV65_53440 [Chromatiales bacterium]|nr:hypothetical protein [Chromatiales bacterium]